MLADVSGVLLVFGLGVFALAALAFVQRAMGEGQAPTPTPPKSRDHAVDARRRVPLPFARVLLLWLLAAPALALVTVWSVAVRDLGAPALGALGVFAVPLFVVFLAFVSKRGLEP